MLVYRIEDWSRQEYRGPYAYFTELEIHGEAATTGAFRRTHPFPPTEGIWIASLKDSGDFRYAFASLEQLHAWFDEGAESFLANRGFEIVVYDVPDSVVAFGKYQVSYRITDELRFVETIPLEDDGYEPEDDVVELARHHIGFSPIVR
jgi:hypothetical protein